MQYWKKVNSKLATYQADEDPELIHIIKTGFDDMYIIVYEDAYGLTLGNIIMKSSQEIKDRFGIDIIKDLG